MKKKIFNPLTRYQTKGVECLLSQDIINILWSYIDELNKSRELDYLQVFEFKVIKNKLAIEHRQEVPYYKTKYVINDVNIIYNLNKVIVFVIDNGDYSIMMLSNEY